MNTKCCKECGKELSRRQTYFCSNECKLKNKDHISIRTKPKDKLDSSKLALYRPTGKTFKDYKNYSGVLTKYLESIDIQADDPLSLFEIVDNPDHLKPKYQCKYCDWTTKDAQNKSGCITVHIQTKHNIEPYDHIKSYKEDTHLFIYSNKAKKRVDFFDSNPTSYLICRICNKKMMKITNTHLESHGITPDDYRKKYGVEILSSEDVVNKSRELYRENRSLIENAQIKKTSKGENDMGKFLTEIGIEYRQSVRGLIYPLEVDYYVEGHNIAIEYNGTAWHSERFGGKTKNYHLDKLRKCEAKGVRLLTIFEDEWVFKKEIVKRKLKNAFKLNTDKIYSRKCEIREVDAQEKNHFLNTYHIQGEDKSNISIALFYEDKMVSVMTFSHPRIIMGYKGKHSGVYELSRFASSTNVVGAASRLLKFFIKNYSPKQIFSFADRRWTSNINDSLYEKIGFTKTKINPPTFWVLKNHRTRYHRFSFNKKRLVNELGGDPNKTEIENLFDLGYDRIWDCGNIKYVMDIPNS